MANLNYKKFGEGEPLIIMHGLYGSSDNWVSIARDLMSNFSVYLIDLRNHGGSAHLEEHNYDVMVDDLADFMNECDIYSSILIGHSMGGKVAMFFSAAFPERVKRMVIVDISPRTYKLSQGDLQYKEHSLILKALISLDISSVKSREEAEFNLKQSITSEKVLKFLLKNLRRDKQKKFYWKINVAVLEQNIANILEGLERVKDELNLYQGRVLFVKGENSDYIKNVDKQMIADMFLKSQIVEIENASHWIHAEKPAEFINEVRRFILS